MEPAAAGNTASEHRPRQQDGHRGGRGRGRGRGRGGGFGDRNENQNENETGEGRGAAPGSGGGEGRGKRRGGQKGSRGGGGGGSSSSANNAAALSSADLGARFSQSSSQKKVEERVVEEEAISTGKDEESEVCFICASPIVHYSVAPCNHRTCHICALRMRALYKTKDCAHCRTASPYVIFTDYATKRYEEFSAKDTTSTDENIGIRYENNDIVEDTLLLLRYNCPDGDCDVACLGWPDLHRHVRAAHHKKMCDLCTRHKKVFTHEHELFTDKELAKHMTKGDDNPGAIDQSGFRGHPLCGFCGQRFYGDDELYVHCREKHERCFICDRRGGQPQYYVDYNSLEVHFRKDHFLCPVRECLEKKFVVFPSEIDLKAHQLQEHGSTLSKDVRRDARVVDMSTFDYRAPYVQERRGGGSQREARGRGRGRDPNTEPLPVSSAQPLRRDEQAFQRQMAIHSAQSVSTRTFGGQLTSTATPPAGRVPAGTREPASMTVPEPSGSVNAVSESIESMNLSQGVNLTPEEQARELRHRSVIERASILLQNDHSKIAQFRNSISSFKSKSITAAALIDSFFALFSDTSSNALGTLIREIADLYEDKSKADSLRTAWNDWRAINEDYPSLPGLSGLSSSSLPLGWATVTSSSTPSSSSSTQTPAKTTRVLKLKSSTAQSSRSSVSQTRSWGSASATASNSSSAFPSLPTPAQSSRAGSGKTTTTPWVNNASSAPSSTPASAHPTPPTSRPASRGPPRGPVGPASDAFPALPPAAKPQSTIFGYGTGMVRRDVGVGSGRGGGGFAWGGSGSGNGNGSAEATAAAGGSENEEMGGGGGKKKGNKGKKQVLMNWG